MRLLQVRGTGVVELPPAPDALAAPGPGLLEWTLQVDHLAHPEFFLGVVDPDRAPKTPYCLHRSDTGAQAFVQVVCVAGPRRDSVAGLVRRGQARQVLLSLAAVCCGC